MFIFVQYNLFTTIKSKSSSHIQISLVSWTHLYLYFAREEAPLNAICDLLEKGKNICGEFLYLHP